MILLLALQQILIPSPYDPSAAEWPHVVRVATPYIRCINAHLPAAYFDWPRQPANDEERMRRAEATAATFDSCESELNAIDARTASGEAIDRDRVSMFLARISDSYIFPVLLGSQPNLLIDPRRLADAEE